tara:strand:+ start:75 stop:3506 length:3432 start_codon:yes stop_codon:yes gene_type:complete
MNISNEKDSSGSRYWKSLDDLAQTPSFRTWVEREFPQGASMLDGVQRRNFMKVMAASFGLAGFGMTGCRRPEQAIMPYGRSPEEIIPGVPVYYCTSQPNSHGNQPLIVESHQARPTKIEGNPSYLPSGGATDIYAQASVLNLYDPDRSQGSYVKKKTSSKSGDEVKWEKISRVDAEKEISKLLSSESLSSGSIAVLADKSSSPSRADLVQKLKDKGVFWAEYEAIDFNGPANALADALGVDGSLRVLPKLGIAKRILSIDCDFLSCREPEDSSNTRGFSKGRKADSQDDVSKMNRLYSVESDLTRTGGVADHRLRLESSRMVSFVNALAAEVLQGVASEKIIKHLKDRGSGVASHSNWIKETAKDLSSHKGKSLVLAGNHLPDEVHILTCAINKSLEANGKTVDYAHLSDDDVPDEEKFSDLVSKLKEGLVTTLIFMGGNPAYLSCGNVEWSELTKNVKTVLRFGYEVDETSQLADLHVGASHYLESWGDGRDWSHSSYFPIQPLISPLFETFSELEFLCRLAGIEDDPRSLVEKKFNELSEKTISFEDFLRVGLLRLEQKFEPVNFDLSKILEFNLLLPAVPSNDSLEVLLVPDFHTWDGRYSNNGWMQECPDPMSKLTWDNAILVSPVMARFLEEKHPDLNLLPKATMLNKNGEVAPDTAVFDLGKQDSPIVKLSLPNGSFIEGPLHVQPGLADYTLVATLGMGRKVVGRVGTGTGYDSSALLGNDSSRIVTSVSLTPTSKRKTLANVQEHWSMEGRAIVREANVEEYLEDENFASKMGAESHSPQIYGRDEKASVKFKAQTTPRGHSLYEHPDHNYEKSDKPGLHQWGMAIDLNLCTGCNACVVACQSENNIPVVGKDQVLRGREMHWIRLDRYFSSTERDGAEIPSDVQVNFQGVSCMHCETAPCEQVCPVNATVHDEEGLNAMAYNRCVGTRYCANNCPYKVRRFNFFDWNKRKTDQLYLGPLGEENPKLPTMANNPDVTVRMRGVMEKCTYCVQRIQEAKIRTKVNAQRTAKFETGKNGPEIELGDELKVPDGTMKTACQQVCSADAISFGDLSDPESEVTKKKENPRNYSVLGYLDTRPRTTYLARVRNPNPEMPDFTEKPYSSREYHDRAHPSHDDHGHEGHGEHPTGANGNSDH